MDNSLAIIHNGIIENYSTIKEGLKTRGYKFKSETDTEVLINLISYVKKNENTTFVAYKAPKIEAPRPAHNYQRKTRKKGLNIRKKILTRLWAFGPANLICRLVVTSNLHTSTHVI